MRAVIMALLIAAIVCQAPTTAVNTLDNCLKQVKASMHEAAVATQLGLSKNFLDMAKDLLETGADATQS
jgi:ABC-type Fe3+ transport system permease subunit